jgi:hypothetical protein
LGFSDGHPVVASQHQSIVADHQPNQTMRTKAQVALTALEQALKITGVQESKRDDEFTAAEYADKAEMHTEAARRLLGRYVKAGTLSVRKTAKGHFFSVA